MDKQDLINYYGTLKKAGEAIGRSKGAVSNWPDPPPFEIQCTFQVLTNGALKAERRNPRYRNNTVGYRNHLERLENNRI